MIGEVIMLIGGKEMVRAAQVYVDTIYRVPVEVVGVKQRRLRGGKDQFEIRLRGVGEEVGVVAGDSINEGV